MGIRDWLVKKLSTEPVVADGQHSYVLKRQNPKGRGMIKVMTLAEPVDIDDIYESLDAGLYALDMYTKGTSGFKRIWGVAEVTGGKEKPIVETDVEIVHTAGSQLVGFLEAFKELKEQGKAELALLQELFGGGSGKGGGTANMTPKEILLAAKGDYDELVTIFGQVSSGGEGAKYEGSIPMILHPDVIPKLVDGTLNSLESRMMKWGLIEGNNPSAKPTETIIELPVKPQKTSAEKEQTESESDGVESATE